jgi:tripeptide aminopeptidase
MRAYERLLDYVKFDTTSDENAPEERSPSTKGQLVLADHLAAEMKQLGFQNVRRDSFGYVYGFLPSNCGTKQPVIGLIAHMDTSSAACGSGIKPRIVKNYGGGEIVLNEEKNIVLRPADSPCLKECLGMNLIVTDGTTLLGADDKAGIAEILTAAELLNWRNIPHGPIAVAITPDEEIGRGTDHFDLEEFGADFAYTVDGGKLGQLEYENFNAASAVLTVHGIATHPGDAKNKMKNAVLLGIEFNALLPPAETPEHTEGYEGFFHLLRFEGSEERAELHYIVRDHDRQNFEARKAALRRAADYLNDKYGAGTFELQLKDQYFNMKPVISRHMEVVERAERAMRACGVEPKAVPIRGGTDGAMLSCKGLPCPNLSTGGFNFHSRFEFIPVQAMDKMADVLVELVRAEE